MNVPSEVKFFKDGIKTIACGYSHVASVDNLGDLHMWGSNESGILAIDSKKAHYKTP